MIQIQLGTSPITEEEAKKHFKAAVASGDPVKYAAQVGAAAACAALTGGWTYGLCALGSNYLIGKLFSGCESKGGTIWCLEKCTQYWPPNPTMNTPGWCGETAPLSPAVPIAERSGGGKFTCSPAMGHDCCSKTYCQLPGMPAPLKKKLFGPRIAIKDIPLSVIATDYYPEGSITTQTVTGWRVAVPTAIGLSGPDTATHQEINTSIKQPFLSSTRPVQVVSEKTFDRRTKKPWYKNWRTYAIASGVVAVAAYAYKRTK